MLSTIDIMNAFSDRIEKETGCEVYSNEVLEGFRTPCFFIKLSEKEAEDYGRNLMRRNIEVSLNYFPPAEGKRVRSELDGNSMAFRLHRLFHLNIPIGDRVLLIKTRRHDFGGENYDILIFTLELDFFDDFEVQPEPLPIEKVQMNMNLKIRSDSNG